MILRDFLLCVLYEVTQSERGRRKLGCLAKFCISWLLDALAKWHLVVMAMHSCTLPDGLALPSLRAPRVLLTCCHISVLMITVRQLCLETVLFGMI